MFPDADLSPLHIQRSFLQAEGPMLEKHTVPTSTRGSDIIYNSCKYIEVFHCHPRDMVSNLWSAISQYSVLQLLYISHRFYSGDHFYTKVFTSTMCYIQNPHYLCISISINMSASTPCYFHKCFRDIDLLNR